MRSIRLTADGCDIGDCDRRFYAHGLVDNVRVAMCSGHYNRLKRTGTLDHGAALQHNQPSEQPETCEVIGCDKTKSITGRYINDERMYICAMHASRWHRKQSFDLG